LTELLVIQVLDLLREVCDPGTTEHAHEPTQQAVQVLFLDVLVHVQVTLAALERLAAAVDDALRVQAGQDRTHGRVGDLVPAAVHALQDLAGRALPDFLEHRDRVAFEATQHTYSRTGTSYSCRGYTHNTYSWRGAYIFLGPESGGRSTTCVGRP